MNGQFNPVAVQERLTIADLDERLVFVEAGSTVREEYSVVCAD